MWTASEIIWIEYVFLNNFLETIFAVFKHSLWLQNNLDFLITRKKESTQNQYAVGFMQIYRAEHHQFSIWTFFLQTQHSQNYRCGSIMTADLQQRKWANPLIPQALTWSPCFPPTVSWIYLVCCVSRPVSRKKPNQPCLKNEVWEKTLWYWSSLGQTLSSLSDGFLTVWHCL